MSTALKKRPAKVTPVKRLAVLNDQEPSVIPYGRFSSIGQAKGGSQLRQEDERAKRYAEKVGLPFNETLGMFDHGFSGYQGDHITKGALGKFLKAIEGGLIPAGSILWVESIDRLTRQNPMKALKMILFGIIERGVGIYVDDLHTLYNDKNADDEIPELYGEAKRAYRESKRKSDLTSAAWNQRRERARETGEAVVATPPYWLKIVGRTKVGDKVIDPGKYEVIPEAAKAIVKMFKLAASGLGYDLIQQQLNHDTETKGAWVPPKRRNQAKQEWRRTYIQQCILKNRAVIGEYQPHRKVGGKYGKRISDGKPPMPEHYPNVLKDHPGLFELVQQKIASKRGISQPGPKQTYSNVVTGLAKCGYCGGAMHYGAKGRKIPYLYCYDSGGRKPPRCPMMKYEDCETPLLNQLRRLKPEQVLPKKDKQRKECERLRQEELRTVAQIEDIKQQIANYTRRIGKTNDEQLQIDYENEIATLRSELLRATKHLAKVRSQLQDAERDTNSVQEWQSGLAALKELLNNGDKEIRPRLNDHLREFIDRIEIFGKGFPADDDSDDFGDYFQEVLDDIKDNHRSLPRLGKQEREEQRKFVAWVMAQRKTKAGRFLRVHLKMSDAWRQELQKQTGDDQFPGFIDIVPDGSIADRPNIKSLWEQFKNGKKRQRVR